jgi:hypothetical protein
MYKYDFQAGDLIRLKKGKGLWRSSHKRLFMVIQISEFEIDELDKLVNEEWLTRNSETTCIRALLLEMGREQEPFWWDGLQRFHKVSN